MDLKKLPLNAKKLLDEILQAEHPSEMLCNKFKGLSYREDEELRGIIRELREEGYINVKWADNLPYWVSINNSARTYNERLEEYEMERTNKSTGDSRMKSTIFISHRSMDKAIADMLVDFFSATGFSRSAIFCSSLPGNDINERISAEVKNALQNSVLNIAILSQDYYQSAYCLNEAGILWFLDEVPVIPIALPEITSNNMYGFLNNEYKLRRLDCDTDISYIYDSVSEVMQPQHIKATVLMYEMQKLKERYANYLAARETSNVIESSPTVPYLTTDDERIVLYYILDKKVRKVSKDTITMWLSQSEIYNVNVDNAFDLLSSIEGSSLSGDSLKLGIEAFRDMSSRAESLLLELSPYMQNHAKYASDTFNRLWEEQQFDDTVRLFISYIIDERMCTLGDRWMATAQTESIKQWESKYSLDSTLSENYGACLELFKQHDLVYESSWTSYGNPREYTLYPSLKNLLFNCPEPYVKELQGVKEAHTFTFPF